MSRIKVDRITDKAGTGAPILVNGVSVTGKSTLNDVVGAAVTFNSVTGDVTGDVTGNLTGNVTGNVTGNLTGNVTGNLTGNPTGDGSGLTNLPSAQLTGALPAISGANLTNLPPSGNTATLVADGAIAAGKPCIIKTNGKAAQVGEQVNPTNPAVANGDMTSTNVKSMVSMAYHTGLDKYVMIGGGNDAFWITGENNGANTIITESSQYSLLAYQLSACMACYHESQERVIFLWWNSQFSDATALMVATHGPNLNSASDFNANSSYNIGNRARPIATVYYSPVNVCCFMVQDCDSGLGLLYMLDTTTSTTVADNLVNKKATITLDGSAQIEFGGVATDGTVIVAAYKKAGTGVTYKIITGTNATTYVETSEAKFEDASVSMEEVDITYDTNAGKFVLVYKMTNNYLKAVVGTLSGTGSSATISWGTPVQMSTDAINQGMSCKYDPNRKETIVVYSISGTGSFRYVSISGTTPTWGDSIALDGNFYPVTNRGNHFCINVNPDSYQMAIQWQTGSGNSGSHSRYELVTGASVSSNLSSDNLNFIGFVEDAISDGATGTIKGVENVVGNQSGLTPGQIYSVEGNGNLTAGAWTTHDVGLLAIAADKGIVRRKD